MSYLGTPDESPLYEAERSARGYVPNYLRVLALRPEVYDAWLRLAPVDVAVMDFADRVARDPTGATEGDVAVLRGHGLADADILQIVLAVCLRRFFSGVLSAVGAVPDPVFDGLPAGVRAAVGGTAELF
ncbi:hypothetical protein [Microbispora triticiradicis]|uniref:hypothetical protein n=1 Tax=Microbispora triticiradicis TaxID=2200763 RepID=UPI001AD71254|nr:hypothetical protein [Microbispora triticiradicis]MBO4274307.1 hypothetical protein [Microbispora triticiradicis]